MNATELIEKYREKLKVEIDLLLELTGHNFEQTQFVFESALDLAFNDKMNEFYK
jgi:hypothetical protein